MSVPDSDTISVVMPMRNVERFVLAAARSVLGQAGVGLELIVVDDGSTDRSRAVVERIRDRRVRVIDGPRRGIAAALNAGLAVARGGLVCRCDADDLFAPGRLARQARRLAERPELSAVCGQFVTMSAAGRPLAEMDCGNAALEITGELRNGRARTSLCTYLIRTGAARAVGFREAFVTAEDIDFALRLGEAGRVWFEPRVEYFYRLHGNSITHCQPGPARVYFDRCAREMQVERGVAGTDLLMRGGRLEAPAERASDAPDARAQAVGVLLGAAWRHRREGRALSALGTGVRACARYPGDVACWRSLGALVLKREADLAGGGSRAGG